MARPPCPSLSRKGGDDCCGSRRAGFRSPEILPTLCVPGRAGPAARQQPRPECSERDPGSSSADGGQDPGSRPGPSVCPPSRPGPARPGPQVESNDLRSSHCPIPRSSRRARLCRRRFQSFPLSASPDAPARLLVDGHGPGVPRAIRGLYRPMAVKIPALARTLGVPIITTRAGSAGTAS
jgi:hypothetical protein